MQANGAIAREPFACMRSPTVPMGACRRSATNDVIPAIAMQRTRRRGVPEDQVIAAQLVLVRAAVGAHVDEVDGLAVGVGVFKCLLDGCGL